MNKSNIIDRIILLMVIIFCCIPIVRIVFFEVVPTMFQNNAENRSEKELIVTSSNMQNEGLATGADGWIYYYENGKIYKVRMDGSYSRVICSPKLNIWSIMVAGQKLYFTATGRLYCVSIYGGKPKWISSDKGFVIMHFFISEEWIYYTVEKPTSSIERSTMIRRMRLDGSEDQALIGEDNDDMLWFKDVSEGYVYCLGFNHAEKEYYFCRVPLDGDQPELIDFVTNLGSGCGYVIQVFDGWIYYCELFKEPLLWRIRVDGSEKQLLYDGGYCTGINVTSDWIYCNIEPVREDTSKSFYIRMKLDGTDVQYISVNMTNVSVVGDILYSSEGLMRIEEKDGQVYLSPMMGK